MRLIRFIVNWSILLSAPLWAGFFGVFCMIKEIIKDIGDTREVMAGKDWIWMMK